MRLIPLALALLVLSSAVTLAAEWSAVRCNGSTCHVWRSVPVRGDAGGLDLTFMEVGRKDAICLALNAPQSALPFTEIVMAFRVDDHLLTPRSAQVGRGFLFTCGFEPDDIAALETGRRLVVEAGSAVYDLPLSGSNQALKALRDAWLKQRDERIRALEATIAVPEAAESVAGG
ncbi:hypothetical protein [Marinivivus vitaminiproducens]|uniref:hypothetical protein n=1 Tax=Marinivivus vitaminiproducens TaxID=3035935 RepID=UPI0027A782D1|nr:hypothetical protein P4R82_07970 [Geminicoccaceae bacterium SCSIO 64248]